MATGDSIKTMSLAYRLGMTTVGNIISETCSALWDCLVGEVFMRPTKANWKRVAGDFYHLWNFPNCLGAVDGKHVVMQVISFIIIIQ